MTSTVLSLCRQIEDLCTDYPNLNTIATRLLRVTVATLDEAKGIPNASKKHRQLPMLKAPRQRNKGHELAYPNTVKPNRPRVMAKQTFVRDVNPALPPLQRGPALQEAYKPYHRQTSPAVAGAAFAASDCIPAPPHYPNPTAVHYIHPAQGLEGEFSNVDSSFAAAGETLLLGDSLQGATPPPHYEAAHTDSADPPSYSSVARLQNVMQEEATTSSADRYALISRLPYHHHHHNPGVQLGFNSSPDKGSCPSASGGSPPRKQLGFMGHLKKLQGSPTEFEVMLKEKKQKEWLVSLEQQILEKQERKKEAEAREVEEQRREEHRLHLYQRQQQARQAALLELGHPDHARHGYDQRHIIDSS
ncbi:hypothetical protein DIPPA_12257 [Diplonema papillatum]|nr:hypothetical protein DIPPA_12257 [Diplonema papillatum]